MGRRPGMLVAVGAVLLIVGAAIVYLVLRNDKATPNRSLGVLVATAPIAVGEDASTSAATGKLVVRQMPADQALPGAIGTTAELAGEKFSSAISANQQITSSVLQSSTARPSTIVVPPGKQAVAVTTDYSSGGGGYVTVGDHVSIYDLIPADAPGATGVKPYSKQLVSSALVLDVSSEPNPNGSSPTTVAGSSLKLTLLLALSPQQAEQVAFATTFDSIYLGILAPGETPGPTGGVGYGHNFVGQP